VLGAGGPIAHICNAHSNYGRTLQTKTHTHRINVNRSSKTVFTSLENCTGLESVIINLVSSAYNTNLVFLEVTEGKSFINNIEK
jgi:hypothetical protein